MTFKMTYGGCSWGCSIDHTRPFH